MKRQTSLGIDFPQHAVERLILELPMHHAGFECLRGQQPILDFLIEKAGSTPRLEVFQYRRFRLLRDKQRRFYFVYGLDDEAALDRIRLHGY